MPGRESVSRTRIGYELFQVKRRKRHIHFLLSIFGLALRISRVDSLEDTQPAKVAKRNLQVLDSARPRDVIRLDAFVAFLLLFAESRKSALAAKDRSRLERLLLDHALLALLALRVHHL